MDIKFDNLVFLHLLWGVPACIAIYIYGLSRRRAALARFAQWEVLASLVPSVKAPRRVLKAVLIVSAIALLAFAVTGLRWGMHWEDVPQKGIDIMVVLDVSRSMLAEDVAPNRLERAKLYIEDLVHRLPGDRIGLVAFAGKPVMVCPLTTNYGWFLMTLDEVDIYSSPVGGSSLGDAVRLAANSYVDRIKDHKAMVILTDGEDQESYPVEAAAGALETQGIRVFTVGLGDDSTGARIPIEGERGTQYLMHEGQQVWSRMNPDALTAMALAGGGSFVPAGTKNIDLGDIYESRIATLAQREFETERIQTYDARYQWFAGLALLLLMVESWMGDLGPRKERVGGS